MRQRRFEVQEADVGDYDIIIHPSNIRSESDETECERSQFLLYLIVLPFVLCALLFIALKCHWMLQTDIIITS